MQRHLAIALAGALALSACGGADDDASSPGQVDLTDEPTATETVTATETETTTATETETVVEEETVTETETETTSDAGSDDARLALTQTCDAERWSVDIPEGWWANDQQTTDRDYEIPACAFIHPSEQQELEGESLQYAARIYIDGVPFEDAAVEESDHVYFEDTTVAGNEAVVFERESDGSGLVPEGERSYGYIVRVNDSETLFAFTHTPGETDYQRDAEVLDRMMETLELNG